MNYTQEQLAALSDIELNLIMARDVAGLDTFISTIWEEALTNEPLVLYYTKTPGDERYVDVCPDYLHDLNAIDDLCKAKGFMWSIGHQPYTGQNEPKENRIERVWVVWRKVSSIHYKGELHSHPIGVRERKGEFPRCRFLCEALVLAWQESKK